MSANDRFSTTDLRYWSNAGEGNHAKAIHLSGIPVGVYQRDKGEYAGKHRPETSEGEGGTVLPCSLGDDLDSPRRPVTRTSPSDTNHTTRRVWCCGTPVTGPHTEGCEFEPRGPLDYDGPVEIRRSDRG